MKVVMNKSYREKNFAKVFWTSRQRNLVFLIDSASKSENLYSNFKIKTTHFYTDFKNNIYGTRDYRPETNPKKNK